MLSDKGIHKVECLARFFMYAAQKWTISIAAIASMSYIFCYFGYCSSLFVEISFTAFYFVNTSNTVLAVHFAFLNFAISGIHRTLCITKELQSPVFQCIFFNQTSYEKGGYKSK